MMESFEIMDTPLTKDIFWKNPHLAKNIGWRDKSGDF